MKYIKLFKNDIHQIYFEFVYLIVTFTVASILLLLLYLQIIPIGASGKPYFYSILGGFLGGWAFDARWFYRVTARGKETQYPWKWDANKFYWRILIPFVGSIVGLAMYLAAISEIIPFIILKNPSSRAAFAFSFILGYFSDTVIGRMSEMASALIGKGEEKK